MITPEAQDNGGPITCVRIRCRSNVYSRMVQRAGSRESLARNLHLGAAFEVGQP
jgi:hypothetical protein